MDPLSHWKENRDIKLQGGAPSSYKLVYNPH